MPSDAKDSLNNLVNVFSALNKMREEPKGVSSHRTIIKDNEDEVTPTLSSSETARLKNIATVLGKAWQLGEFAPKPEAERLGDLTPDKQKALGISTVSDKVKPVTIKQEGKMDWLTSLLGLLGLSKLKDFALKMVDKLKSSLGSIFKFIGTKLYSGVQWVGGKINQSIKWLANKLAKWASGVATKIKTSKFYTGFLEKISKLKDGLKSLWDDAITAIRGVIDDIVNSITRIKDASLKALQKIPGYKVATQAVGAVTKAAGTVAKTAGKVIAPAARVAGAVGKAAFDAAKSYITTLFSGSAGNLGKFLSKIPVIAPLIETGFTTMDIAKLKADYRAGRITLDELNQKSGTRVVKAISGVAGATIGGAALSFIPGIGTIAGAVGGDLLGRYVGDLIVEKILSPNVTKKVGAWAAGTTNTGVQIGELQDFIVQNGTIVPFSDKDKLLSMKKDGAFDNLLKSNTENAMVADIASYNKFAKTALVEQIKRQDKMIDLLVAITRKSFSSTIIQQQPQQSQNYGSANFRDDYSYQTLVTN